MEAFSLLKYWRGGGVVGGCEAARASTTIVASAAAANVSTDSETDNADEDDDDGPFFDLEFAVQDGEEETGAEDGAGYSVGDEGADGGSGSTSGGEEEDGYEVSEVGDGDGGEELNFSLSSSSCSPASSASGDGCAASPSDDLFFKGRLVAVEPESSSEPNPSSKPHLPVSLMKSATRLRVFMLGLKKSKAEHQKDPESTEKSQTSSKLLAVKFKVEEVPIISLFTRDDGSKSQKQAAGAPTEEAAAASSDEKIFFSKEALQRYLKKVKPLYVRVSRRYGEKLRFSTGQLGAAGKGQAEQPGPAEAGGEGVKGQIRPGNIPAGLRVVCKHLGKSRSASSAVAAAPPSCLSSSRRDDSLIQQEDGIQSAILHCKRSFNASRDSSESSSLLERSVSEPLQDKSTELLRRSS